MFKIITYAVMEKWLARICVFVYLILLFRTHLLSVSREKHWAQSGSWQLEMLIPGHERGLTARWTRGPATVCLQRDNLNQASWLCAGRTSATVPWLPGPHGLLSVWIAGFFTAGKQPSWQMDIWSTVRKKKENTLKICLSGFSLGVSVVDGELGLS